MTLPVTESPTAPARTSMRVDIVTTFGINQKYRGFPEYQLATALARAGQGTRAFTYAEASGEWGAGRREMIEGVEVRRVPRQGWWAPGLARAIAARRPEVAHLFHWSNQLAYTAALTCRALGIPYAFSPFGILHDRFLVDDRDRPYERPLDWSRLIWRLPDLARLAARSRSPRRALRNYLTHHPLVNADLVIALSRHGQQLYQQWGIPAERTRAIPCGIDLAFTDVPDRDGWRDRWPRPVVMFIGQLKYRKGWDILLQAAPGVLERHPTASFVFNTHSPVAEGDFHRLVRDLGIGERVHLLHRISEEDKARLYRAADIMCLPTRYESFGLPVAEAMAAGCPVVTTQLPVMDEIVTDGQDGVLVPYDDPAALARTLSELLADAPLRARLAANGLETVRQYDIERVTALHIKEYERLVEAKARRAAGPGGPG